MDTKKIEQFLTLAQQLNYSKAAEILNITQPTLSRSIMSLEEELGVMLFDRSTNKMQLTPAGLYLAESLRDVGTHFTSALQQALSLQNGFMGQLRIGVTKGQSISRAGDLLQAYQALHPDIRYVLLSEDLTTLRCMLDNHSLDFAVGYVADYDFVSRYAYHTFCETPLRLVISSKHHLAKRNDGSLRLIDFRDETFLTVSETETPSVRHMIRDCIKAGFWPKCVEVPDLLSSILWVEAGLGVAGLTEASLSFGNPKFCYVPLPELTTPELAFIWSKDNDSAANRAFIAYLQGNAKKE